MRLNVPENEKKRSVDGLTEAISRTKLVVLRDATCQIGIRWWVLQCIRAGKHKRVDDRPLGIVRLEHKAGRRKDQRNVHSGCRKPRCPGSRCC